MVPSVPQKNYGFGKQTVFFLFVSKRRDRSDVFQNYFYFYNRLKEGATVDSPTSIYVRCITFDISLAWNGKKKLHLHANPRYACLVMCHYVKMK